MRNSKSPRLGYQSVSDTWGLAKIVRKVEVKLLHLKGFDPKPLFVLVEQLQIGAVIRLLC